MEWPKISIIIPCYNYQDYVLDCIDSCFRQDYKGKYEVIVIDDCSTDRSVYFIDKFFRGRVTLIQFKQNCGYSKAKNEGIIRSTGKYITTIDADDMLTDDSLTIRASRLANNNIVLVHGRAYTIKGEGGYDYWYKRRYKCHCNPRTKIHAQTVMMKREVYLKYGLYDELLRSRSDNEMWCRLRNVAGIGHSMYYIDHAMAYYRKHDKSMIEYRKNNPRYNFDVTEKLKTQKYLREVNGITKYNTRMLEK